MGEATRKVASRILGLEQENQALRDCYFSIVKHLGRVRIPSAIINTLQNGDGVSVRAVGDETVFEWEPTQMVVPGGVQNGKGAA